MSQDFTPELCDILDFVALISCEIRMCSAFNPMCGDNLHRDADLLLLSDVMHNFHNLAVAIRSGEHGRLAESCQHLIREFSKESWLSDRRADWKVVERRCLEGAFEFACSVFQRIQNKALVPA